MCDVLNLATGKVWRYSAALSPDRAVVCAYEQERGNYNTWEYPALEQHPEQHNSRLCYTVGDWTTYKDGRQIN